MPAKRLPVARQVFIKGQRQPLLDITPAQADPLLDELALPPLPPQCLRLRLEGDRLDDQRREIEAEDGRRLARRPTARVALAVRAVAPDDQPASTRAARWRRSVTSAMPWARRDNWRLDG